MNVTDESFRFPQTWRTNVGVDRRLPLGFIGTVDFIYNRDMNAPVYLNANLPSAQSTFTGVDTRPRWVATAANPACATAGNSGPCVTRINNAPGNQVTAAYVIKNSDENYSWNISGALTKPLTKGFQVRGGFNYGDLAKPGRAVVDRWQLMGFGQPDRRRPEQPGTGLLDQLARQARVPAGVLHPAVLQLRRRPACRSSTTAAPTATPAGSSRVTPTATRCRATT